MQTNVLLGRIACTCTPQHSLYADDAALLVPSATDATTSPKSFSDSASHLGLNISWPKTKLQNIGSGPEPPDISVDGNTVESVNSFVYLGSLQSSDGQCRPDLTRRIGLACAVMTSLKRIWSDKRLILDTKLRIYQGAYNQYAGYKICVRGHTGQHLSRRPK